jgi:hypothetical protein
LARHDPAAGQLFIVANQVSEVTGCFFAAEEIDAALDTESSLCDWGFGVFVGVGDFLVGDLGVFGL